MKEQKPKNTAKASKIMLSEVSPAEKKLDELIEKFVDAADAKGWSWSIDAKDQKNFRYATVTTERGEVIGTFEITCDKEIKLSGHATSFHSHGLKDLREAAWNEIVKLPWLKTAAKAESKQASAFAVIEKLFRNFHRVARQLKHRHNDRAPFLINDEYDIQDLLHAILRGATISVWKNTHPAMPEALRVWIFC
jgi:ribosome-associated translation inhibitor RaiA